MLLNVPILGPPAMPPPPPDPPAVLPNEVDLGAPEGVDEEKESPAIREEEEEGPD